MTITYAARSHPGLVRGNNEDNLYLNGVFMDEQARKTSFAAASGAALPCLFAVCDGMGGNMDGEWASLTTAAALKDAHAAITSARPEQCAAAVNGYVTMVNDIICDAMREKNARMGTTLALMVVTKEGVFPFTAGDSRIYALTDGELQLLSEDHTMAMQKVKMGILTEEQARADHDWHKLTRYLGIFPDEMQIEAEAFAPLPLQEGMRLLLCSDGLTDLVPDARIGELLRTGTPEQAVDALTQGALQCGGKDNITCVVLELCPDIPGKIRLFLDRVLKKSNAQVKEIK